MDIKISRTGILNNIKTFDNLTAEMEGIVFAESSIKYGLFRRHEKNRG